MLHREEESHSGLKPVNIIVAPKKERGKNPTGRSGTKALDRLVRWLNRARLKSLKKKKGSLVGWQRQTPWGCSRCSSSLLCAEKVSIPVVLLWALLIAWDGWRQRAALSTEGRKIPNNDLTTLQPGGQDTNCRREHPQISSNSTHTCDNCRRKAPDANPKIAFEQMEYSRNGIPSTSFSKYGAHPARGGLCWEVEAIRHWLKSCMWGYVKQQTLKLLRTPWNWDNGQQKDSLHNKSTTNLNKKKCAGQNYQSEHTAPSVAA